MTADLGVSQTQEVFPQFQGHFRTRTCYPGPIVRSSLKDHVIPIYPKAETLHAVVVSVSFHFSLSGPIEPLKPYITLENPTQSYITLPKPYLNPLEPYEAPPSL